MVLMPGSERSPGGGQGNLLHSCSENAMDRKGWWAIWSIGLQGVRPDWNELAHMHTPFYKKNLNERFGHLNSKVLVTQSFSTLWCPMDCTPPGSSVHGIFQARILKWFAISFSRASSIKTFNCKEGVLGRDTNIVEYSLCSRHPAKRILKYVIYVHISVQVGALIDGDTETQRGEGHSQCYYVVNTGFNFRPP